MASQRIWRASLSLKRLHYQGALLQSHNSHSVRRRIQDQRLTSISLPISRFASASSSPTTSAALEPTSSWPRGHRLQDKVCIVTGSSSGLGRAIALAFASQGARLVVCADIRKDPRSSFHAEEAGIPTHEVINQRYGQGKGIFQQTDATKGADVKALVDETVRAGGRLDVIVNNAGIGGTENHGQVHELEEDVWDMTMNINSKTVFLGCKYACAQFLRQEPHSSGHRGWIVNTASIMGLVGQMVNGAAYCASKGAVVLLTKSVAVAYAKHKIHCNALCPGHLRTPMTEDQYQDPEMRRAISALYPWGDEWGAAEDVAKCAVFLASDDAAYVTGVPLPVDGGYCAQ